MGLPLDENTPIKNLNNDTPASGGPTCSSAEATTLSDLWKIFENTDKFLRQMSLVADLTKREREELQALKDLHVQFDIKLLTTTQLDYDVRDLEVERQRSLSVHVEDSVSVEDLAKLKMENERLKREASNLEQSSSQLSLNSSGRSGSPAQHTLQTTATGSRQSTPPPIGFISLPQMRDNERWICQGCSTANYLSVQTCGTCEMPRGTSPGNFSQ